MIAILDPELAAVRLEAKGLPPLWQTSRNVNSHSRRRRPSKDMDPGSWAQS
jgi:hypothetical protein